MTAPRPDHQDALDYILDAERRWEDALLTARLLAVDPEGLGGVVLRSGPGPARQAWLDRMTALAGGAGHVTTVPPNADDEHLAGGLDLIATLTEGRRVEKPGLLKAAGRRLLVVPSAERLRPSLVHILAASGDARDPGASAPVMVLIDESDEPDALLGALEDRLAFRLSVDGIPMVSLVDDDHPGDLAEARQRRAQVRLDDRLAATIAQACLAFGIASLRADQFCARTAIALAALDGRTDVEDGDVETAARLVLGPRARQRPAPPEEAQPEDQQAEQENPDDDPPAEDDNRGDADDQRDGEAEGDTEDHQGRLDDAVIEAILATAVSLSMAEGGAPPPRRTASAAGRKGALGKSRRDGRPIGSEPGDPRRGGRLDILATLRAAAPWQKLRPPSLAGTPVRIYPTDLRISRYANAVGTSVLFVVDASGSAAMHRLAEAKGAVEALLGECYSRRDTVGLITFRGTEAVLDLPPCRSLTRARRVMAGLPGGGGTPLASALALALTTALEEQKEGRMPLIVLLTDAKGNIALNGEPGRRQAGEDAERLAEQIARAGLDVLFFDTSPRPDDRVRRLSDRMRARYVALPYADQKTVTSAVERERKDLLRSVV